MTVARSDPPGPTLPLVTSQLNSDPNKGTQLDSSDREKDAFTWKRGAERGMREKTFESVHLHLCIFVNYSQGRG